MAHSTPVASDKRHRGKGEKGEAKWAKEWNRERDGEKGVREEQAKNTHQVCGVEVLTCLERVSLPRQSLSFSALPRGSPAVKS